MTEDHGPDQHRYHTPDFLKSHGREFLDAMLKRIDEESIATALFTNPSESCDHLRFHFDFADLPQDRPPLQKELDEKIRVHYQTRYMPIGEAPRHTQEQLEDADKYLKRFLRGDLNT